MRLELGGPFIPTRTVRIFNVETRFWAAYDSTVSADYMVRLQVLGYSSHSDFHRAMKLADASTEYATLEVPHSRLACPVLVARIWAYFSSALQR